jgi:hypothetical protein
LIVTLYLNWADPATAAFTIFAIIMVLRILSRLVFKNPEQIPLPLARSASAPWGLDRMGRRIAGATERLNMQVVRWSTTAPLKASLGLTSWSVRAGTAPARNLGRTIAYTAHAALTLENFHSIYFMGVGAYVLIGELIRGETNDAPQAGVAVLAGGLLWVGAHTVDRSSVLGSVIRVGGVLMMIGLTVVGWTPWVVWATGIVFSAFWALGYSRTHSSA